MFFVTLAKLSSDEGHFSSGSFRRDYRVARVYEGRSEGLGLDFLAAVDETTRRIEQFPEAGQIDRANIRKRLVSGFPFTILYELQPDRLFDCSFDC